MALLLSSSIPTAAAGGGGDSLAAGHAEDRKLFMGGLPNDVNKDYMEAYFSQFGQIEDSIILMDKFTGRSKGYGFITFIKPEDMETCVANGPHVIMGKAIDVKRAADGKKIDNNIALKEGMEPRTIPYIKRDNTSKRENVVESLNDNSNNNETRPDDPRKVFIGGIPMSVDKDRLSNMLSHYGNVIDCDIMYDKNSGRSRGFGRATFSKVEEAQLAIIQCQNDNNTILDGRTVEIKPLMRLIHKGGNSNVIHNNILGPSNGGGGLYEMRPNMMINTRPITRGYHNEVNPQPCKVFLGGIAQSVNEDRIRNHLSQYGKVVDVRIYHDKPGGGGGGGGHKGFGYAVMSTPLEAQAACKGGNKNYIHSKWVQIKPFCALNDDIERQQQQQGYNRSLPMRPTTTPQSSSSSRSVIGGVPAPPPLLPSSINSIPLGGYRNRLTNITSAQNKYLSTSLYAQQGYKTIPKKPLAGEGIYRGMMMMTMPQQAITSSSSVAATSSNNNMIMPQNYTTPYTIPQQQPQPQPGTMAQGTSIRPIPLPIPQQQQVGGLYHTILPTSTAPYNGYIIGGKGVGGNTRNINEVIPSNTTTQNNVLYQQQEQQMGCYIPSVPAYNQVYQQQQGQYGSPIHPLPGVANPVRQGNRPSYSQHNNGGRAAPY